MNGRGCGLAEAVIVERGGCGVGGETGDRVVVWTAVMSSVDLVRNKGKRQER